MHRLRSLVLSREEGTLTPACERTEASSDYWGLRIASIFIILAGSGLGAILPVWLARTSRLRVPQACFFVAKYFGSGVILATAWMHLLSPASDNLRDECLSDRLPDYDWAMAIGLMTVMVMFLVEIVVSQFDWGFASAHGHSHGNGHSHNHERKGTPSPSVEPRCPTTDLESGYNGGSAATANTMTTSAGRPSRDMPTEGLRHEISYLPGGEEHLAHQRDHVEGDSHKSFAAQMTALFILEFGVIFHSVFIGLTLAVTDNFIILFIVLVFHQTFEGLGLGARLATATWPPDSRRWTPYLLAGLYAISTPIAIGIGLGVNKSLTLDAAASKIVNGVFDAISGGILMYTGLVELLAHEFMFNPDMRKAGLKLQLSAYACVAVGVGLMAMLANWA